MIEAWRERASVWQGLRVVADDLREIDDERVLVFTHLSGRGKTSGVQLGQMPTEQANLLQIRDSRVTRLVVYGDRDRALADLGLAPEG